MEEEARSDFLMAVLQEAFEEDCERVGKSNLRDIVERRGDVRIVRMEGASRIDWGASLAILASAASLANHALSVLKQQREAKGAQKAEIVVSTATTISFPKELADKLSADDVLKLTRSIESHIDRYPHP